MLLGLLRTALQLGHAEEGPGLVLSRESRDLAPSWLHAFVREARRGRVSEVKWPKGLEVRQEVGVYVYKIGFSS